MYIYTYHSHTYIHTYINLLSSGMCMNLKNKHTHNITDSYIKTLVILAIDRINKIIFKSKNQFKKTLIDTV